jgi:hypothetical protein
MPRKKNEGGGASAPTSNVKYSLDDSKQRQLEKQLAQQQEQLTQRQAAMEQTKQSLHRAQHDYDICESRFLAGRTDSRKLGNARTALDEAKKQAAIADIAFQDADRQVREILPMAITTARTAALAELRDRLRRETQAKAKQLAALLAQAKALSDELRQLSNAADTYFTVNEMVRLQVSLIGVMDLGEEHGYVSPRAGIPNLACGWLTGQSLQQPTMFDVWRRELEAFLEHSPAEMAEADKLSRVTHIAQDARRYKECLVREEAQRKLEALMEARAGGKMPKNTTVE